MTRRRQRRVGGDYPRPAGFTAAVQPFQSQPSSPVLQGVSAVIRAGYRTTLLTREQWSFVDLGDGW